MPGAATEAAMNFVVIGKDADDGTLRKAARADHLDYISGRQHMIVYAGPLIEDGRMIGSIFVFEVPDRETLEACMADDPYFTRGIYGSVEVYESRWMVPEREPGALSAEAARARAAA
jgi:uncharacterized protein YciI